ncbi:MAG: 23S rRNA (adenine(2503)-C(2))-methyltransferase RlmN, partial [Anaerolineae bacterium]
NWRAGGEPPLAPSTESSHRRLDALDLSLEDLPSLLEEMGEPAYRARQVYRWLYVALADDFGAMTDLPKALRARLAERLVLGRLTPLARARSANRQAEKVLFGLPDGETVEAVLMRYRHRLTACISSQVGCPVGCPFCATGQSGFRRNLTAGEMVEQVLHFERVARRGGTLRRASAPEPAHQLTNVVLMGMGEPFLNYEAVLSAIRRLADPRGFGFSPRRATISTVGVVPGILRLAEESLPVRLAVSLHAAEDALRDRLVPMNRRYPLVALIEACRQYVERTGRRVSFEYALIEGINDAVEQAGQLADLLDGLACHVNLIPLNPVAECPYRGSPRPQVLAFARALRERGVPVSVRLRRGLDIEAGCGQLRRRMRGEMERLEPR